MKTIYSTNRAGKSKWTVKAFGQVTVLALLIIASMFLAGCSKSKDYLKQFNTALEENRLIDANKIFVKAKNDPESKANNEDYLAAVKPYLDKVISNYKSDAINYDLAMVELDNYLLGKEFSVVVSETVENYKKEISTVDTNAQLQANAETFSKVGDYLRSIRYYEEILKNDPENEQASQGKSAAATAYTNGVIAKAKQEINAGYPATAIVLIEQANEVVPENEVLKNLRKQAEDKIRERKNAIQKVIIKNTIDSYLYNANFKQAEEFIASLKAKGLEVTEYETRLEESKKEYINAILNDAASLAGSLSGRWQENPYSQAIAKLEEGLVMFPSNQAMQDAKAKYESMIPTNLSKSIYDREGKVESGAKGTDATGFEHSPSDFNRAVYVRPDASFKFDVDNSNVRILAIPQTDEENVYKGAQMEIKINGSTVYESDIFSDSTNELLFEYEVEPGATVEINVLQSGFASFFDKILGRNGVYFEIFGY